MTVQSFLCHRARRIVPAPLCPCNRSYACDCATVPVTSASAIVPVPVPSCPCNRSCARATVPVPTCLCQRNCARAIVPVPSCLCPSHRASACVFLLECQIQNAQFRCQLETIALVGGCDAKSTKTKSASSNRWLFDPSVCAFPVPPPDKPSMAT